MPNKRTFLPFGEWLPDQKLFLNSGLVKAENVVPVYGNYFVAPKINDLTGILPQTAYGIGTLGTPTSWLAYVGTTSKIYEVSPAGAVTDRSGAAYATPDTISGSQITAFGQSVVESRYTEPPQVKLSAGTNFVPLHSATFAPAGRFPFSVRGNLFMAHCSVPAPYDAVPAGANPQLVAWSQTDAPRFFGGPRVDPQLVGSDYQQIGNDYGVITGAVGGNYALIFQQRAIVRVDGPPYTFQEVVRGKGMRHPNSIVQNDQDTYFWGESGPSVLEYGGQLLKSDQITVLGAGKCVRTLIDNVTGFSAYPATSNPSPYSISGAADVASRLIFWSVPQTSGVDLIVVYNLEEKRFSVFKIPKVSDATGSRGLFLRNRADTGDSWRPGRNQVYINRVAGGTSAGDYVAEWIYQAGSDWDVGLEGGYSQLDPDMTTRVLRVRPIVNYGGSVNFQVTLRDTNRPYDSPTSINSATQDNMGWFVFPGSLFTDFHAFAVTALQGSATYGVVEWKGFEVEYVTGPAYSA